MKIIYENYRQRGRKYLIDVFIYNYNDMGNDQSIVGEVSITKTKLILHKVIDDKYIKSFLVKTGEKFIKTNIESFSIVENSEYDFYYRVP